MFLFVLSIHFPLLFSLLSSFLFDFLYDANVSFVCVCVITQVTLVQGLAQLFLVEIALLNNYQAIDLYN